jgi:ferric-dicitrate binding protein FerR (iron transport regulator)
VNADRDPLGEVVRIVGRRLAPPEAHYEQVLAAATDAWQRKVRSRRRRRWLLATAAAMITMAVGLIAVLQWMPRNSAIATATVVRGNAALRLSDDQAWQPLHPGSPIPAGTLVRTGARGTLALTLDGGTAVRVKELSDVTLESTDMLRLRGGTIYVDSGLGQNGQSVRIQTDLGTVRDIGTIFEIRATPSSLRIRVREGRVDLEIPAQSELLQTGAGEQLEIDPLGTIRRSDLASSDAAWRWAEALATAPEIEGRPLLQFLAWVARETGRRLEFEEPAIEAQAREVVLHGKTRDLAPLQALDLLLSTTDLEYVLPSDDVIVIRRRTEQ